MHQVLAGTSPVLRTNRTLPSGGRILGSFFSSKGGKKCKTSLTKVNSCEENEMEPRGRQTAVRAREAIPAPGARPKHGREGSLQSPGHCECKGPETGVSLTV